MAKYRIEGSVVDTDSATKHWEEKTRWDGHNRISVHSGSQWDHQILYRSRKGRYYIEYTSQWQGSTPRAELISPQEAVRWLLLNEAELPKDLKRYEEEVAE